MQLFGNNGNNSLVGGEFDDQLFGGKGSDTLDGLEGNDLLMGGTYRDSLIGGLGNDSLNGGYDIDTMAGGLGNDFYAVNDFFDLIVEQAGEGVDTVFASTTFMLPDHVERAILTGTGANALYGNGINNELIGNAGDNALNGGDGNDTLVGNAGDDFLDGGTGIDILRGGLGNDIYYVTPGDIVHEYHGGAAGGVDIVYSETSFSLAGKFNLENLFITTNANAVAVGNAAQNMIVAADGHDFLYGGGGDDNLIGNAGNDHLDGGKGNDFMAGGLGHDVYVVNSAMDIVFEDVGQGIDTVKVWLGTYSLDAELENLTLLGNSFSGTGNAKANLIHGSEKGNHLLGLGGADSIYGLGGMDLINGGFGNDLLDGGAGHDVFEFTTGLNETTNVDTIQGFSSADDKIALSHSIFGALSTLPSLPRALIGPEFALNTVQTSETRIVYHEATGGLYYDADGTGAALAVKFASLDIGLTITEGNFIVA